MWRGLEIASQQPHKANMGISVTRHALPEVQLDAFLCPDGVERTVFEPVAKQSRTGLFSSVQDEGPGFRCRSSLREVRQFRLSGLDSLVALLFANARSEDDLLAFFTSHGMLIADWAMTLSEARRRQASTRAALERLLSGSNQARSEALELAIELVNDVPANLKVQFEDGHLKLVIGAKSLWQFIILEILSAATAQAELHVCKHCGRFFLTGPMTGRRSTAQYCKDKCRVVEFRQGAEKKRRAVGHVDSQA